MNRKKYNPLLEVKQKYDNRANTILQSYKDCFDSNSEYEKFCDLVCNTVLAAISGINNEETKISLSPDFYRKELREKTILDLYKTVLSNPISYSMNDTSFQSICNIIWQWYDDTEKLKNARRGIIAKIVYEHFKQEKTHTKYSKELLDLFKGHEELINKLIGKSDDEKAQLIREWNKGKDGKPLIKNFKDRLRKEYATQLKKAGLISESIENFRKKLN